MAFAGILRTFNGLKTATAFTRISARALYTTQTEAAKTATAASWSNNSIELVNRLREQQKYYATVVIKGRPFTVTQNDIIVMDRIKDLELGDSLSLNQVTELGSHDYTIKGQPMVDPSLFKIEATVIEHPDGKLFTVTKKKQRTAHHKTTYHRNRYTMLRVSKIDVNKF
ncbi:hypothetical protein LPJ66_012148 [Kickxella alabastrina]|uniref:Uncharacterized protein n=1 Tax=Kickxella alabastrina TaxID=61397 RepID=A0ACC1HY56_9FUNG|nr:hypothetical protein LPJ66_012148 [Kickxella alabastrina]